MIRKQRKKKNADHKGIPHSTDSHFSLDASCNFEQSSGDSSQNKVDKFMKETFACKDKENSIKSAKKESLVE